MIRWENWAKLNSGIYHDFLLDAVPAKIRYLCTHEPTDEDAYLSRKLDKMLDRFDVCNGAETPIEDYELLKATL